MDGIKNTLKAMSTAAVQAHQAAHWKQTREFLRSLSEPDVEVGELRVSAASLLPSEHLAPGRIEMGATITTDQIFESDLQTDIEIEGGGKIGGKFPFIGSGEGSLGAKYGRNNTQRRATDHRACIAIKMVCEPVPLPEGLQLLYDYANELNKIKLQATLAGQIER